MSSILKVDTIQDQAGNNIISEAANVITIGASGDTITVPAGATVSGFTSAGIDDNATSTAITIDSSERVGIGTSSPQSPLHVIGTNGTASLSLTGGASTSSVTQINAVNETANTWNILEIRGQQINFDTASSERMRITSAGLVGIGTSAPTTTLDVDLSGTGETVPIVLSNRNATAGTGQKTTLGFGLARNSGAFKSQAGTIEVGREQDWTSADTNIDSYMAFSTYLNNASTEKLRIDSSGNLLVGKTSANTATAGVETSPLGRIGATRSGNITGLFNRLSSDGEIVRFQKDGTTVGSIASHSGTRLKVDSNSVAGYLSIAGTNRYYWNNTELGAGSDNSYNIGGTSQRFKDLYLSGGAFLGGTGTANKLDDYEEGTWTPTFLGSGTNPTQTYTTRNGIYVKIGKMVHCQIQIYLNNGGITSGTGTAYLGGLPFTASATAQGSMGSCYYASNWLTSGGGNGAPIGMFLENNQNQCFLVGNDSYSGSRSGNAGTFITAQSFGNFTFLVGSISYQTDA